MGTTARWASARSAGSSSSRKIFRLRGFAYRVLAEHFRARIQSKVHMLRVNPDARIQRAIVPIIADDETDAGPQLASLLVANPAREGSEDRPGLLALRIELIERLA